MGDIGHRKAYHASHCEIEERYRKDGGQYQSFFACLGCLRLIGGYVLALGRIGLIPRLLDGGHQLRRAHQNRVILHFGKPGDEVDRSRLYTLFAL
ncbi:hypothetical protein SDC9_108157 [bioreactor metagenome]|uniref:Uncharacterized protein n=1 Tax=bioreactor metagenome TaxID=1076179 RepID=A0A645B754_9ZZZZ